MADTKRIIKKRRKVSFVPYLYLLPGVLLILMFTYYPFAKSIYYSTQRINMMGEPVAFVGLDNFKNVIEDPSFRLTLYNTARYLIVAVPCTLIFGLSLALLANKKRKLSRIYELMFALPMAVSMSSTTLIFMLLLNPSIGMVNYIFRLGINWFGNPTYAMIGIAMIGIWLDLGYDFLFILAAVRNIPNDLIESCDLAGANYLQKVRYIILPLISPTMFFLLCTNVIYAVLVFGPVNIVSDGNVTKVSPIKTLVYWMYQEAFANSKYGIGNAIGVIAFLIVLVFTLLNFLYEKKGVHYS